MFFIFGWGRGTDKDLGPTLPINCPNCHNDTFWHFHKRERWFTLFFIPVFPYESKYLFICPTCSRGVELKGDHLDHARRLNSTAQDYFAGKTSEADFKATIGLATESVPLLTVQADIDSSHDVTDSRPVTYCPSCAFQSFNAVATHCPSCKRLLVLWPPPQ